ncbi:substrate-binding domain-containing protein [Gemmiger qucibialis]|uniref:substrate-binding domain-containing protein n=2 Tax=Gemmiger qucibialis TaxID=2997294 RepID=UPI0022E5E57F|nr:substrate-binding domain-containing protein [Gemmiger qucibialis]
MKFLQGKNIRIPEDIQIIGFDDSMASKESNPSLTTIHQEANLRQYRIILSADTASEVRQMLSQKRR